MDRTKIPHRPGVGRSPPHSGPRGTQPACAHAGRTDPGRPLPGGDRRDPSSAGFRFSTYCAASRTLRTASSSAVFVKGFWMTQSASSVSPCCSMTLAVYPDMNITLASG